MVDDLGDTNLIDVGDALLTFVMVDQNNVLHFPRRAFDHARSLKSETVEGKLRFPVNFAQGDGFHVPAQLGFQIGISDRGADGICVRIFVSENQYFVHSFTLLFVIRLEKYIPNRNHNQGRTGAGPAIFSFVLRSLSGKIQQILR
ncbi:hypothetical protein D1872_225530 [compost metagenome]